MTKKSTQITLPLAIYDFTKWPLTYDYVSFLAAARSFFLARGHHKFGIILYRPYFRNSSNYENMVKDTKTEEVRFTNIILKISQMIDCIEKIIIQKEENFDVPYRVDFPPYHPDCSSTLLFKYYRYQPWNWRNFDSEEFKAFPPVLFTGKTTDSERVARPMITLSLRNSMQKPGLSVNLSIWYELSSRLRERGFRVIVIPDHDDFFGERLAWQSCFNWEIDARASWDLEKRSSLYEAALTNIMPGAGWNTLVTHSEWSIIWFVLNSRSFESSEAFYNIYGPKVNVQPHWFSKRQVAVWNDFSSIEPDINKFDDLVNMLLSEKIVPDLKLA